VKVYFFLPSTDFNATVEEMIWTFGIPLRDHARDQLQGLNPIQWETRGRTPSDLDEHEGVQTDAGSIESVNDAVPVTAAQDPTTEAEEDRYGETIAQQAEKV
jgi:hypothetical protein